MMKSVFRNQQGFTLVEIAIVLLIVTILLGYTVAMFPRQQELKQYRAAEREMDQIIDAIIGFAQVNGRLPCPTNPNLVGVENGGGAANCSDYGGFVPINTLGITGRVNADTLLLDPWGNPYRYYVSFSDSAISGTVGVHDFVQAPELRAVGIIDSDADGYTDLDGRYVICDDNGATIGDDCDGGANPVFGNPNGAGDYGGAPFVLLSMGKNWSDAPVNDELENRGGSQTLTDLGIANGPSGNQYFLKNVGAGQTTFIRRPTGFADDFDDIVKWASPHILFSKMIEAGRLP